MTTQDQQDCFTVARSTCERYDLRPAPGTRSFGWAVILLDERGGVLSIQSDYGDWSYHWCNHGRKSFKHFLVELDRDHHYLIRKLGGHATDFDFDASVKRLKKRLGELYRDKRKIHYASRVEVFDKEKCAEAVEATHWLDSTNSADDFGRMLYERSEFSVLDSEDISDIIVKNDSGSLGMFLETLWPAFVEALKREIAESEGAK